MAWGENKADIVREAVEGPETEAVSASFLQSHRGPDGRPGARFFVDEAAAKSLTRVRHPWRVGRVEWDDETARRAVIWLAFEYKKPVLKLIDDGYNKNGMADLLTRQPHGRAYELNIAIFNRLQSTISGWPGGKPNADDSTRPERALPFPKRALILSPEPQDDVLSIGATMNRLVEHGHNVHVTCMVSGDLRVSDAEAARFAKVLLETAEEREDRWDMQANYARDVLEEIKAKGPFGESTEALRRLKGHIRRGEARDACQALGIGLERVRFLDLPFYSRGRYRRFVLADRDIDRVVEELERLRPDQIYSTGHLADPNSVQGVCWGAFREAWERCAGSAWRKGCRVWLFRGHQKELEPHEIAMAVPLSPDQLAQKLAAIQKFQTHTIPELLSGDQNRRTAGLYDELGMAEYEAIECFERWA
jgi:glucosamine-6-phosphate deaminase